MPLASFPTSVPSLSRTVSTTGHTSGHHGSLIVNPGNAPRRSPAREHGTTRTRRGMDGPSFLRGPDGSVNTPYSSERPPVSTISSGV